MQVRGLVDAVEGVLSATAAAAGHVTTVASSSTARVEDAREVCLSRLEALRTATHALPATSPAVSGGNAGSEDQTLRALRAERDQLRAEVKQKTAYEMLRSLVGSEMCIRDSLQPVLSTNSPL